ncbi:ferritin-like domain-containing protein [Loigolactobacillus iwatensis]|uniref:ferritin-like domain-containing protein n=1 Tax=Loigolactobacillus iwatensis TaxID=1267156 RepID=UPI000F7F5563|nr:ferritin-like domain-containing protein [Loigolactobacillus iwatensis]
MAELTIDEKFEQELKQADIDHHTPTAGAMTGHILSNLVIQASKLQQAAWYVKGPERFSLVPKFTELLAQSQQLSSELGHLLLDEGEVPPSTTADYQKYSMLEESGKNKYFTATAIVDATVHDYDTENLFIDRAIKLAEKEERPALAAFLVKLRGINNHNIRDLQFYLGNGARTGLDEEDDDDD